MLLKQDQKVCSPISSIICLLPVAYENKVLRKEEAYDKLYVCGKCQEGCETCVDDTPCLATYNWTFR